MKNNRIKKHPVLNVNKEKEITLYWEKKPFKAKQGEILSSALIANGIKIFGHHRKDGSAQGIFCANGQCSKCMVIANGKPVKSCMTKVKENMIVEPVDGVPELPNIEENPNISEIEEIKTDVLIIGGGPSGLTAAIQLGKNNIKTLIVDDKNKLGGKLVLQTHKFFGSEEDSYAGTRGMDIGEKLSDDVKNLNSIDIWLNSTAVYVFKDKKVGILKNGVYKLVTPKIILNAAGAREKFLRFAGNTLSGIYGAGAFQTLVNRDLVKPTDKLFIIGGGNVGLIAGYHAIQAGIDVVGLVEAMPKCGGYKVHSDKLKRLGVPIYTSHSIVSANGKEEVSSITIAEIDKNFQPIKGTEKSFACDTILIAVGLESLDEFTSEAEKAGIEIYSAGDANEIAEASSAMFNGKIAGLKIAKKFKPELSEISDELYEKAEILKAHPGEIKELDYSGIEKGVVPVLHCFEQIPCNPCTTVCPTNSIKIDGDGIYNQPRFDGTCIGCGTCVAVCPGLAITLVDYRKDSENPLVTVAYEISNYEIKKGDKITVTDFEANVLGELTIEKISFRPKEKTHLVSFKAPKSIAKRIASFKVQNEEVTKELNGEKEKTPDNAMVCVCERVTVKEVRDLIKKGVTDLNQIKAITRAGMGACGSKTCNNLVKQIYREEGYDLKDITDNVNRPVFVEIPLGVFSNGKGESNE